MISWVALHQLGYGDIHLPIEAEPCDDGRAHAEYYVNELISHAPIDAAGRVYYDAVACYNEYGVRVRIFATSRKWVVEGELVSIHANEN